jgi:hypothetical protein
MRCDSCHHDTAALGDNATCSRCRTKPSEAEVRARLDQLQELADNPRRVLALTGRRPLEAVTTLPRDSRRPNDSQSTRRYAFDNSISWRDQDANYAAGLL